MKKFLSLFLCSLCFAENIDELYKEAQNLENQGNYKEAMLLYKKAADLNTPEDKYILDLAKNNEHKVDSFTNMKKAFYQNQIDKVNDKETDENLKQIITSDFGLYPYKKNYILPITYQLNTPTNQNNFEKISVQNNFELAILRSCKIFGNGEPKSASFRTS